MRRVLRSRMAACSTACTPAAVGSKPGFRSSCASGRRSRAWRACSNTRAAGSSKPAADTDSRGGTSIVVWAEAVVPVKSLCPCSKEISDYGAHNQRSHVTLRVELLDELPWTELVRFAEDSASCEIWPMLKRADEKWVTERAYENPKFVEDLVRDVALRLNADPRVGRYSVDVENFESIHAHSAYARIERN